MASYNERGFSDDVESLCQRSESEGDCRQLLLACKILPIVHVLLVRGSVILWELGCGSIDKGQHGGWRKKKRDHLAIRAVDSRSLPLFNVMHNVKCRNMNVNFPRKCTSMSNIIVNAASKDIHFADNCIVQVIYTSLLFWLRPYQPR